ncbi:MAG: filamentous hemagglutinin N-terminal domain-containing protein [Rhizonema sp. PD38]|nr:filamentous hemagglutinin N-terminal domain-containing protein [Rhizonema sp. PD38]
MSEMGKLGARLLGIILGGAYVLGASSATAQITPDRTLPNNSSVTINGSVFNITGGTQAGRNLFHSFQQFSVPTGGTASFNNGLDIQNIISRVTGGEVSNIDGIIRALGTANLFFLNPNGIVFGKNASLNVGGSFLATTANAIQFGNQGTFSASVPDNPALLTVNPSALLYNQIVTGASIQNNSQTTVNSSATGLQVSEGKSLLLAGGNVNLDGGGLIASGGRVELASLGAPGTIGLNAAGDTGNTLSLTVPGGVQRGNVSLSNQSFINVSGEGGGDIAINAGNLKISNSFLFAGIGTGLGNSNTKAGDINITVDAISLTDSAQIDSFNGGKGDAGDILITARDAISLDNQSILGSYVLSGSEGNGGNINITTGSLFASNGGLLSSTITGKGKAGNVTIIARDVVSFDGLNSGLFSNVQAGAVGNGGNVNITANSLSLTNGGQLNTSILQAFDTLAGGQGIGGSINLNVANTLTISGTNSAIFANLGSGAIGRGGDINIQARNIFVRDGGLLNSSTSGTGNSGNITIIAKDAIAFDGVDSNKNPSTLFNVVNSGGVGNAGNINLTAGSLYLTNGGQIASDSLGKGDAGNIFITTIGSFSLTDSTLSSGNLGQGNAGNIMVLAQDNIFAKNSSIISTIGSPQRQQVLGNIGNIELEAKTVSFTDGAKLQAGFLSGGQGNSGIVSVKARDSVSFAGPNTGIFTNVVSGAVGNGSDIQISAPSVSFTDGTILAATNAGRGNSGNITITSGSLSLSNNSVLTTSNSGLGNAGNIVVPAKDTISVAKSLILSNIGSPQGQQAAGKVGNIQLEASTVSLTDGAQLQAGFYSGGQGNPGIVSVKARDSISFAGTNSGIFANVDPGGVGNGSDIQISAPSISFTNGAILTTTNAGQGNGGNITITAGSLFLNNGAQVRASTLGHGNAGNVTITANNNVLFDGFNSSNGFPSGAQSTVEATAFGNGGSVNINAASVALKNGAQVRASTLGHGNAGNVTITANNNVLFDGFNSSNGFPSGAQSAVEATAFGNGGSVNINAGSVAFKNGAQVLALTRGHGNAGNVTITTNNDVLFDGFNSSNGLPSGVFASVSVGGVGNGGNVNINAGSLALTNSALLSTSSSTPRYDAGDLTISTDTLRLDGGFLRAETVSSNGGNIALQVGNYLLLKHNSLISTTAGTASSGGNGGNITISTPFVIALPLENSDITANAFSGSGGRVSINATNLFNIASLSRQDLERLRPHDLDPRQLLTNDITAVSQQNPDLSGTVQINTPDIDPNRSLITLPTVTEVAPKLVSSSCAAFADVSGSNFTVTGRSGLPPSPDEPLTSDVVWTDTRIPVTTVQHQHKTHGAKPKPQPIAIIPATGWVSNDKGEVTLISSVTNATTLNTPTNCLTK